MNVLLIHPSPLMHSEIYLRLEPLGIERVAQAIRAAGHEVHLVDLQIFRPGDALAAVDEMAPDAVGFSLNYLPNTPEVIDLALEVKRRRPHALVFVGGHSASFVSEEILEHAGGAIDCILRGEGEASAPLLLEAWGSAPLESVPGAITASGSGPPPPMLASIDDFPPARDLTRRRQKYFIGVLDPCASVEFSRGCPWDCVFCSAWTFYGRSYRQGSPEAAAEDVARIEEPNVFVVDDVAFIHPEHGFAIGREIERRGIRKEYYLETRCDVLIRNREVFAYWKRLGLRYMFLGIEAIDEEGLRLHRKRVSPGENFRALEIARELGITVAINIIADPDWDEARFRVVREWAQSVPEIVHLTVNTPYPGTETWLTESRKLTSLDYRLFDVQHAVLPTRLPLDRFYRELVATQEVLNRKHLGAAALWGTAAAASRLLLRGQTNFVAMLWKFRKVYNAGRQHAEHSREVRYAMRPPVHQAAKPTPAQLYVHRPEGRSARRPPAADGGRLPA
ncbi:MAG: hopanoid methylase [Candidatus Binatota bacterium]|nr:hopanoid methylase [Candidatus Binatota bacterium]